MKNILFILFFVLIVLYFSKSVFALPDGYVSITDSQIGVNNFSLSTTTEGAIGYWRFDEGSGTATKDLSNFGRNGNISGNNPWANGLIGKAISLNDGRVEIKNLNLSKDGFYRFSISAWVYRDSENWQQVVPLITKENPGGGGFSLRTDWANGVLQVQVFNSSSEYLLRAGSFPIGEWTHVVVTIDDDTVKIYTTNTRSFGHYYQGVEGWIIKVGNIIVDNNAPLVTGGTNYLGKNIIARMDELTIFDRVLSDEDIRLLAGGRPYYPNPYSNPLGTWNVSSMWRGYYYKQPRELKCIPNSQELTAKLYLNSTEQPSLNLDISKLNPGFYLFSCNTTSSINYNRSVPINYPLRVTIPTFDFYDLRSSKYLLPTWIGDGILNESGLFTNKSFYFYHSIFKGVVLEFNPSNTNLDDTEITMLKGTRPHVGDGLRIEKSGNGYNISFYQYWWFYQKIDSTKSFVTWIDTTPKRIGYERWNSSYIKVYIQFPNGTEARWFTRFTHYTEGEPYPWFGAEPYSWFDCDPLFAMLSTQAGLWTDVTGTKQGSKTVNLLRIYFALDSIDSLDYGSLAEIAPQDVKYTINKVILENISTEPFGLLIQAGYTNKNWIYGSYLDKLRLIKPYGFGAVRASVAPEWISSGPGTPFDHVWLQAYRNWIIGANNLGFHVVVRTWDWGVSDQSYFNQNIEMWKVLANYTGDLDTSFLIFNDPNIGSDEPTWQKFVELYEKIGEEIRKISPNRIWINQCCGNNTYKFASQNIIFNFTNYGYGVFRDTGREYAAPWQFNVLDDYPGSSQFDNLYKWTNSSNYPVIDAELNSWVVGKPWYFPPDYYSNTIIKRNANSINYVQSYQGFRILDAGSLILDTMTENSFYDYLNNTKKWYFLPNGTGKMFVENIDYKNPSTDFTVTIYAHDFYGYESFSVLEDPIFEIEDIGNYSARLKKYTINEFSYANKLSTFIDAPNGKNVTTVFKIPSSIASFNVNVNASQWGYSWDSLNRLLKIWVIH